jgi:hypothetical protein
VGNAGIRRFALPRQLKRHMDLLQQRGPFVATLVFLKAHPTGLASQSHERNPPERNRFAELRWAPFAECQVYREFGCTDISYRLLIYRPLNNLARPPLLTSCPAWPDEHRFLAHRLWLSHGPCPTTNPPAKTRRLFAGTSQSLCRVTPGILAIWPHWDTPCCASLKGPPVRISA